MKSKRLMMMAAVAFRDRSPAVGSAESLFRGAAVGNDSMEAAAFSNPKSDRPTAAKPGGGTPP